MAFTRSSFSAALALFALTLSASRTYASDLSGPEAFEICPNDCGPNGVCLDGGKGCACHAGFVGADCSFPLLMCPDLKMACGNGATCRGTETYHSREGAEKRDPEDEIFECNCDEAAAHSTFEGSQCQHAITDYCDEPFDYTDVYTGYDSDPDKAATNRYAFCTNGGSCLLRIEPHQPHPGCQCIGGYEGRHCQYSAGTAPEAELALARRDAERQSSKTSSKSDNGGSSAGFVFLMLFVAAGSVGAAGLAFRRRQAVIAEKETAMAALRRDTGMDGNNGEGQQYRDII